MRSHLEKECLLIKLGSMRSLGWAVIQHDWCPYKRGNLHTEVDTPGQMSEDTGRMPFEVGPFE